MNDALYIAATGMQAQQLAVDTIANNLANVSTVGFKKARVSFVDLVAREAAAIQPAGADGDPPASSPLASARLGSGVGVASVAKLFDVGDMKQTGSALDVAIQGDGFLEVTLADGSRAFSRGGTLKVNADGLLANEAGYALRPGITVPANAIALTVQADGRVRITVPGQANPVDAGQLELVRFANPGALVAVGANTYRASDASGEAMQAHAGEDGVGALAQGWLEGSNVKMVDEMVNLMVAQRAYEASVKVVQASDELSSLINGLRK
jgi:flagellar basal-body rod protein FlgG